MLHSFDLRSALQPRLQHWRLDATACEAILAAVPRQLGLLVRMLPLYVAVTILRTLHNGWHTATVEGEY